jgi:4'-phosphopantetheinyl transferase
MKRTGQRSTSSASLLWPQAPDALRLAPNEVHVWAAPLEVSAAARARLAATLSDDERERAAQFKFENLRHRYVAGRGLLRDLLSRYVNADPVAVELTYSDHGKPSLASQFAGAGIHFNLAHSDDLALFAFTRAGAVGVDVEWIRPVKDMEELVARFFSPRESELFRELAAADRPAAFFNLWTRKEAMLKATGEGLTGSLSRIEVSFLPGESARVIRIAGDPAAAAEWSLRELSPAEGFVGAVAVRCKNLRVQCWKW